MLGLAFFFSCIGRLSSLWRFKKMHQHNRKVDVWDLEVCPLFLLGGPFIPHSKVPSLTCRTEMAYFWCPLLGDVFKGVWAVNGEAHEDYIRVWVGEGSQTVVVFLACIHKCKL